MIGLIPWYWKALAAVLAIAAAWASIAAYESHVKTVADKAGYDRANGEWQVREAGIVKAVQAQAKHDSDVAHAETAALQTKFDNLADTRQKEKAQHEQDKRSAVSRALAGVERLRLPAAVDTSGQVRAAGNGEGAAAGSGVAAAPATYLLPETAAAILDIAGDYGQLVRDYNTVVDRYADIERACNATTTTKGE